MFVYLFLIAVITTSELPTTDTETSSFIETSEDRQELQELIAIFTSSAEVEGKDRPEETSVAEKSTATLEIIVAKVSSFAEASEDRSEPITITNAIEPSMLAYKHWTGTYSPETFTIAVNGTEIAQGAQYTLSADTNTVDVQCNYSFMNGMRKGTKTVSYQLHENITQANITFSWKDDWQVIVDNGTALKKVTT